MIYLYYSMTCKCYNNVKVLLTKMYLYYDITYKWYINIKVLQVNDLSML